MADEIKIEKGVPMPTPAKNAGKYPWLAMEVGDSFYVTDKPLQQMKSQAGHAGRYHQRKFTARAENGGVRVWRVE